MLNYALNEEKSKTFIRYYKEKDDFVVIHYADRSKMVVENTEAMKDKLNRIEEEQIDAYNECEEADSKNIRDFIFGGFALSTLSAIALISTGGIIALVIGGWPAVFGVCKFSTLFYAPTLLASGYVVGMKLASRKFNLFLKYKDKINEKLEEDVVIENNTNNPVVKPKKIKNLCINGVKMYPQQLWIKGSIVVKLLEDIDFI